MLIDIDDDLIQDLREMTSIQDEVRLIDHIIEQFMRHMEALPPHAERGMKKRFLDRDARPIVFLDIDDVLCITDVYGGFDALRALESSKSAPDLWRRLFDESAKEHLSSLHNEFEPTYVISSSWSQHFTHEQMCEVFNRTGLTFVTDNMESVWTTVKRWSPNRLSEVDSWLREHRGNRPYLIIDDEESGSSLKWSPEMLSGHVHLCNPGYGLTGSEYMACRKLLQDQTNLKVKPTDTSVDDERA